MKDIVNMADDIIGVLAAYDIDKNTANLILQRAAHKINYMTKAKYRQLGGRINPAIKTQEDTN